MNLNAAIIDQRLNSVCDAIRDRAWEELINAICHLFDPSLELKI